MGRYNTIVELRRQIICPRMGKYKVNMIANYMPKNGEI